MRLDSLRRLTFSVLYVAVCTLAAAQNVQVDATPSHVVNSFSPLYALGSSVDRVPSNATVVFFRHDQIAQFQRAGWGEISYRHQNQHSVPTRHSTQSRLPTEAP